MTDTPLPDAISVVAAAAGIDVPSLTAASQATSTEVSDFRRDMQAAVTVDHGGSDIALTGSIARGEMTVGSDCDYLIVLGDATDHTLILSLSRAVDTVVKDHQLKDPGSTGTFGDFATGVELYSRIGLESDTNANTTRRVLLLFESVSALSPDNGLAIRRKILDRYLLDYAPRRARNNPVKVPHFLLNDLVRYWRTMAVDFGAKQWRSLNQDWYLRYAKLLTTRKVLFAGSLASLFTVGSHLAAAGLDVNPATDESYGAMVEYLMDQMTLSPLARLCALHPRLQAAGQLALRDLLTHYETFISMISDPDVRKAIQLVGTDRGDPDVKARVEAIGSHINDDLVAIFHDDPLLKHATRSYGLF